MGNGKWEMREAMGSLFSKLDQEIKLRICLDIDLKIKIGSINLWNNMKYLNWIKILTELDKQYLYLKKKKVNNLYDE